MPDQLELRYIILDEKWNISQESKQFAAQFMLNHPIETGALVANLSTLSSMSMPKQAKNYMSKQIYTSNPVQRDFLVRTWGHALKLGQGSGHLLIAPRLLAVALCLAQLLLQLLDLVGQPLPLRPACAYFIFLSPVLSTTVGQASDQNRMHISA